MKGFAVAKLGFLALILLSLLTPSYGGALRVGFYKGKCGSQDVESIIQGVVKKRFDNDKSIVAALLRMQFHDCFVSGCDASLLLKGTDTERTAPPNLSVRGFDLIDQAKTAVENACPEVVSCADIIAIATRDAVALSGGMFSRYEVETGRRDGTISLASNVDLPGPSISVSDSIALFKKKKLTKNDMVVLLGGHTVGVASCFFVQDRLQDPNMDRTLAQELKRKCSGNSGNTVDLDQNPSSALKVDNDFYKQIKMNRGILEIDQALALDQSTKLQVSMLAAVDISFPIQFGRAMVKLGAVDVLTGKKGQIRKTCSAINKR